MSQRSDLPIVFQTPVSPLSSKVSTKSLQDFDKYIAQRQEELNQKIKINIIDQHSSDWTENKFETLSNWMKIAAFYISIIDKCINQYKFLLKLNTIINLILSTLSGTISVFSFNSNLGLILSVMFTSATFSMAIFSGYIKVDQIQEKLEEFIKLKQDWAAFSAALSAELVLPLNLRQSSVDLINRYKGKFLDLIKTDLDFPYKYKMMIRNNGYSLSQIINNFIDQEDFRLKERNEGDIPAEELDEWKFDKSTQQTLINQEHHRLYLDYDEEFRVYHRENKMEMKAKYPLAKPRQISDKLYEEYQQLMFNVKKDIKYFLKFYNYIALASEERNRSQQYIEQEYHVILNENDQAFVCYALHNWYKEHVENPQKKPSEITSILRKRFYSASSCEQNLKVESDSVKKINSEDQKDQINPEFWRIKSTLMNAVRSVLIQEGPAALIFFVNDFMNQVFELKKSSFITNNKTHEGEQQNSEQDKNNNNSNNSNEIVVNQQEERDKESQQYNEMIQFAQNIQLKFKQMFFNLKPRDMINKSKHYISMIRNFECTLEYAKSHIKQYEKTTKDLFVAFNSSSTKHRWWYQFTNYTLNSNNVYFNSVMLLIGSDFKLQRQKASMYKNPFYRVLMFGGFDYHALYPEFSNFKSNKDVKESELQNRILIGMNDKYKYKPIPPSIPPSNNLTNDVNYKMEKTVSTNKLKDNIKKFLNIGQDLSDTDYQTKSKNVEYISTIQDNDVIMDINSNDFQPELSLSNTRKNYLYDSDNLNESDYYQQINTLNTVDREQEQYDGDLSPTFKHPIKTQYEDLSDDEEEEKQQYNLKKSQSSRLNGLRSISESSGSYKTPMMKSSDLWSKLNLIQPGTLKRSASVIVEGDELKQKELYANSLLSRTVNETCSPITPMVQVPQSDSPA